MEAPRRSRSSQCSTMRPLSILLRINPLTSAGTMVTSRCHRRWVGEVTDARRERQPDQVMGSEQQVGEAGGVGGVLGDRKLGVAVAQGEDLVEGEETLPDPGGNHPGPEGGVMVGHPGEHRDALPEPEVRGNAPALAALTGTGKRCP